MFYTDLYLSTRLKQIKQKSMFFRIILIHQTQTALTKIYVLQKYFHPPDANTNKTGVL